jgi:hypothetical protein
MVESIFFATINEVPEELKEQADDFQKIIDSCKQYADKYSISHYSVICDLERFLGNGN